MAIVDIPSSILEILESFSFKGNTKLRREGSVVEYTDEMVSEYVKCYNDPIYFIRNYVYVVHPAKGVVKFDLYDYQEEMIKCYIENTKVIFRTARQQGKTISSAAYLLWCVIFQDNCNVAVLANKQDTADEILARIRMAYEELPKWMQQGIRTWNKRTIELENGSKVRAYASSSSGIRGKSISILYLDEFAFIPNNQAEDFFTSVYPTITAGVDENGVQKTKIFMTSTPNGYNHFYKFWNEAEKGLNGFVPYRVFWHQTPGKTQKWYDDQRTILGELKCAQEIDAEFLGSSKTLLTGSTLARLSADVPIREFKDQFKGLQIYKDPEAGRSYTMTVDVSRGRHLDYSTFLVVDITEYPHRIVAKYRNNEIAPMLYASIIHLIGKKYNDAFVLVEINDIGAQVADILWNECEYENMFWTKSGDILGKTGADPYPGIRTSKKTKRIGCANLKDIIENNQFIVNDYDFIHELSVFVQSNSGSYEADEGFHDDVVMCGVLHGWLVSQPWFRELTDKDLRLSMHANHITEMENELLAPIILDGTEAYEEENFVF